MNEANDRDILKNTAKGAATAAYYDDVWEEDTRTPAEFANAGSSGEARMLFIRSCLEYIRHEQPLEILDLGCGNGWLETFISPYGTITAVDFSKRTIEAAQVRFGSHATFLLADPQSPHLGLPNDKRFDVVISSEVVEHVENPVVYIQQIAGFLKPQGWCILTTPNGNIWADYEKDERYKQWHQPIENWLTPKQCRQAFRQVGFQVVRQEGWSSNMYPYSRFSRLSDIPLTEKIVRRLKLQGLWKRLMLHGGLLQFVLARWDQAHHK